MPLFAADGINGRHIRDGKIEAEFRNCFQTLADEVVEEEKLAAEHVPFEARNRNWLPDRHPLRNVLCFPGALSVSKWEFLC